MENLNIKIYLLLAFFKDRMNLKKMKINYSNFYIDMGE